MPFQANAYKIIFYFPSLEPSNVFEGTCLISVGYDIFLRKLK